MKYADHALFGSLAENKNFAPPSRDVRVMHVITGLGVGGAESMLASLVGASPSGLNQSVVSLSAGGFHAPRIRDHGVPVYEFAFDDVIHAPRDIVRLAALVRRERPDIVQGWMYHGNIAALAAVALAGVRSTTWVAWGIRCSDRDHAAEPIQLRTVIRLGARLSPYEDILIANSQAGLEYHVRSGYRSPRAVVIQNGIDIRRFALDAIVRDVQRTALGLRESDVVLIHVGRVHPMKDHATFVDVVRRLPHVRALAVGAGTESLPDLPNLQRLGRRADVDALLNAADVIVSTSAYGEGFSNAIAEGMATGLVPVATDVGDAREIVGDVGVLAPPRDAQALASAIGRLAGLPREELVCRGARARQRVVKRFSLEGAIQRFADLYHDMAASVRPRVG